jgi:hypothetical protein
MSETHETVEKKLATCVCCHCNICNIPETHIDICNIQIKHLKHKSETHKTLETGVVGAHGLPSGGLQ